MVVHVLADVEARDIDALQEVAHGVHRVRPPLLQPCCFRGGKTVGGSDAGARRRAIDYGWRIAVGCLWRCPFPRIYRIVGGNTSNNSGSYACVSGMGAVQQNGPGRLQLAKPTKKEVCFITSTECEQHLGYREIKRLARKRQGMMMPNECGQEDGD